MHGCQVIPLPERLCKLRHAVTTEEVMADVGYVSEV